MKQAIMKQYETAILHDTPFPDLHCAIIKEQWTAYTNV